MSDVADPHEVDIVEESFDEVGNWLALYELLEFIEGRICRHQGSATPGMVEAYERIRARLVTS